MTNEFKAEIQSTILQAVALAISQVAKAPVKMHISGEGIILRAMDGDRVNVISVTIEKAAFMNYIAAKTGIVIDAMKFRKLLESLGIESVSMALRTWDEFPEGKTGRNSFLELRQGNLALYFVNQLTEFKDPGDVWLDEARQAGRATLLGRELARAIKLMADTGYNAMWYIDAGKRRFHIMSERMNDSVELVECVFNQERHNVRADSDVSVILNSQYLSSMVPVLAVVNEVDIIIRQDYPVEFRFNLADSPNCKARYVLAPRIETD